MGKKKLVCMALVLAALVCGIILAGCEGEATPSGDIEVYNTSESTTYWVKTSSAMDWVQIVSPDGRGWFVGIDEEGRYTVYYCQKYENESSSGSDLDDRIWSSKSCYVTFDETTEVYIP